MKEIREYILNEGLPRYLKKHSSRSKLGTEKRLANYAGKRVADDIAVRRSLAKSALKNVKDWPKGAMKDLHKRATGSTPSDTGADFKKIGKKAKRRVKKLISKSDKSNLPPVRYTD